MNRRVIIIVSLVLAVLFTLLLVRGVNARYAELKKTVDVVRTTGFIPAGSEIKPGQVTTVRVPEIVGKDLIRDPKDVIGKAPKVSLVGGQYIFQGTLEPVARKPGTVEVHVPVDLSGSAFAVAGDVVDVYAFSRDNSGGASLICKGARVLHAYDQTGSEVSSLEKKGPAQAVAPPGSKAPASIGLEVPGDVVPAVVQAASQKRIYLVKSGPAD
ncbi:SAF domain protein [Desulfofundulus kuznetsovii DSM 6115]|uniref:SAF domain protein n=1 Tax=Desulfofundulus kuznetsovii (strain DSM 6115 / VKM B-1805 / 17) TaxID=760568 RepID=A0AAU8PJG8_DESK7|nr:SAF domain protein [Desulfofundulus kuznetsovii DSM 6115]